MKTKWKYTYSDIHRDDDLMPDGKTTVKQYMEELNKANPPPDGVNPKPVDYYIDNYFAHPGSIVFLGKEVSRSGDDVPDTDWDAIIASKKKRAEDKAFDESHRRFMRTGKKKS